MSFVCLDHPGEIHWFSGYGPLPVLDECPHPRCPHNAISVIAWGPDEPHYELVQCDADCGSNCRAWMNGRSVATTRWLQVAGSVAESRVL